jgi:WD40 repeat protein
LEAICFKCLEKSPDRRYVTAAELAADLRRFVNGEAVEASPQGRLGRMIRRLRRQPASVLMGVFAIMLLAAALVLSLLVIWNNRRSGIDQSAALLGDPEAEYIDGIESASQGYFDSVANRGDVKTAVSKLDAFLERHRPQPGQTDYRGFEWHYLWRLCHPDKVARPFPKLFDLVGHKGEVYFVTFSPDGKRIATAGQDHTARIWNAENGKLVAILKGHTDDVNWLSFSPTPRDLPCVATASDDKTVRIWERESGKLLVSFSADAKIVAVELVPSHHEKGDKTNLEYEIIGGDSNGNVHVWNLVTWRISKTIPAHALRIECLARIRGDDQWLTASSDGTVKEWNTSTWTCLRSHTVDSSSGGVPGIHSASCNTEGTLVALGSGSFTPLSEHPQKTASGIELLGSIPIVDLMTGNRWLTLAGPQAGKESVRFYPGQCLLASAARGTIGEQGSNCVLLSDLPTQRFWTPCGSSHPKCWSVAFAPDGTRFATAATDGVVRVWDSSSIPQGTRLEGLNHCPDTVPRSVNYSPDGRRLLVSHGAIGPIAGSRGSTVWDVAGKRPRVLVEERNSDKPLQSFAACFSPDGGHIAADATEMGTKGEIERSSIRILEADSRREIRRLGGYYGFARKVFLAPQGTSVVAATGDQYGRRSQLNFWLDSNATRPVQTWESNRSGDFWATTLSPDQRLLATNRNQVEIYEFPSLRLLHRLPVDFGKRAAACFSPDGRLLALSADDGTIHVFQPQTATQVGNFVADGHAALSLAFSPDGSRLAAGLDGGARVDLWHVPSGKRLTSLAMPTDLLSVDGLAFAPDGRTLAAAGARDASRGSVFLFPIDPVDALAQSVQHAESRFSPRNQ